MKTVIAKICKILLFVLIFMSIISHVVVADSDTPKKLLIGVKKRPDDCPVKSRKGDMLHMHYTVGTLTFRAWI